MLEDGSLLPGEKESPVQWNREMLGDARVWYMAAGPNAQKWQEFQDKGIIAIGWDDIGDLREFENRGEIDAKLSEVYGKKNPVMDSLACHEFVHVMKTGDHVFAKKGRNTLLGHGIVESDYEFDDARPAYRHVRRVRWEKTGSWPIRYSLTTKSLTNFSSYPNSGRHFFELIYPPPPKPTPYTREKALEDLFLSEKVFNRIVDSLERKKNVVLEGPPGVGKTFVARRLAYSLIGFRAPERVRMIQFHQSYAYEDFIQGYRPKKEGGFELRNGVFFTFCREAAANPDDRYVFIIDEVNRGNLSKIFGELMLLIEADKRDPDYAVRLTYSPDDEPFHIPPNLYLIGMMNTADRSLAMVDYALRRRFAFVRIPPAFQSDQFRETLRDKEVPVELVQKIVSRLSSLNDVIRSDRRNLGPGFEVGHSFFCPGDNDVKFDEDWYQSIVKSEIEPLLREYWFDRPEEVDREIRTLLE